MANFDNNVASARAALAAATEKRRGTVQQWWTRDSIPADAFAAVARAARTAGFDDVTIEGLHEIHERKLAAQSQQMDQHAAGLA